MRTRIEHCCPIAITSQDYPIRIHKMCVCVCVCVCVSLVREALRWLGRNVGAFGGDPTRITIFGESSGGSSVGYHLANPHSWGLFHRAIGQSPGLTQLRSLGDAVDNTEFLLAVLAHNQSAGCVQVTNGPFRHFANTRILSKPDHVLPSCNVTSATAACVADPNCFGFSAATVGGRVRRGSDRGIHSHTRNMKRGGHGDSNNGNHASKDGVSDDALTNCSFHSIPSPTDGGSSDEFSEWTTWVKPASTIDGAAEACLLAADAVQLIRGGHGGHGLIGRR